MECPKFESPSLSDHPLGFAQVSWWLARSPSSLQTRRWQDPASVRGSQQVKKTHVKLAILVSEQLLGLSFQHVSCNMSPQNRTNLELLLNKSLVHVGLAFLNHLRCEEFAPQSVRAQDLLAALAPLWSSVGLNIFSTSLHIYFKWCVNMGDMVWVKIVAGYKNLNDMHI